MGNTIKQTIYFEDSKFYLIDSTGKTELSQKEIIELKSGYNLIISDSELYYTSMEFPETNRRKLAVFITNYLLGSFPQQLCEKFCYISKGDKVLIGIFSRFFADNYASFEQVFRKASLITSPLAGVYMTNSDFTYEAGGSLIQISDGMVTAAQTTDNQAYPDITVNPEAKLTLPFVRKMSFSAEGYRLPAAVLVCCFLIFAAGDYLRLKAHKDKLANAEAMLASIYKTAGVEDSRDPYGQLLALAGGSDGKTNFRVLRALENISKAHSSKITADSMEVKGNTITLQGRSDDYTVIEKFSKDLAEQTSAQVQIVDTSKKDTGITFTLRFEI
jgi:hypothetical protein